MTQGCFFFLNAQNAVVDRYCTGALHRHCKRTRREIGAADA
jgi:hypothetical protein